MQRAVEYRVAGRVGEVGENDGVFFSQGVLALDYKPDCDRRNEENERGSDYPFDQRPFQKLRWRRGNNWFRLPLRLSRLRLSRRYGSYGRIPLRWQVAEW